MDCTLYPRLEQTNGMLQEDRENCHCYGEGEVDSEDDIKNETPLFAVTKRQVFDS
jgi:hypothetical protein